MGPEGTNECGCKCDCLASGVKPHCVGEECKCYKKDRTIKGDDCKNTPVLADSAEECQQTCKASGCCAWFVFDKAHRKCYHKWRSMGQVTGSGLFKEGERAGYVYKAPGSGLILGPKICPWTI